MPDEIKNSAAVSDVSANSSDVAVALVESTSYNAMVKVKTGAEGELLTMDPKLQQLILLRRNGIRKLATTATAEDELTVIANVSDPEAWSRMTEVRDPLTITNNEQNGTIVTGRIPIKRIEHIRSLPFIKSLKASDKLSPALKATIPDIGAKDIRFPVIRGGTVPDVIIGIIDFGCDFTHRNFLNQNGETRLLEFWDQTAPSQEIDVPYGRLYKSAELNSALATANPYAFLNYYPGNGAHGTHVMDIAAGNGAGTGNPGIAPEAQIIFVQPATESVPWRGPNVVNTNFGDSVNLVEAIRYIFDRAGTQPCVINISLGTNGGPHDGSSLVEQAIDGMLQEQTNRAVVIAASNSHQDGIHASGQIDPLGFQELEWLIKGGISVEMEMEIWYEGDQRLSIEVIDPTGVSLGIVEPSEIGQVKDSQEDLRLFISNRLDDPNNHDNVIGIWLRDKNPGIWKIRLINTEVSSATFHAWIERDDTNQSSFKSNRDNSCTLGSISCGHKTITVGAYDARKKGFPISWFSSEGPTRDGRKKPEIAAPGSNIKAAAGSSGTGAVLMSGTSMAAPVITGCIAHIFAKAVEKNKTLTIDELRDILMSGGRSETPVRIWDGRFGYGRIFLPEALNHPVIR